MTGGEAHRYYEDLAVSHVLGGLGPADGQVFRSHLLECEDCRARVWELRALAHDLADVERDERRLRAAKAVETKERPEAELPEPADRRGPGLALRVAVGVLVVTVFALAGWNFMLRGTNERQGELIERLDVATAVLQLGEPARIVQTATGVEASVRVRDAHGALVVGGLLRDEVYGLYFLDASGNVVRNLTVLAEEGRIWEVFDREPLGARLIVTHLADGPSAQPRGTRVLEAELPSLTAAP